MQYEVTLKDINLTIDLPGHDYEGDKLGTLELLVDMGPKCIIESLNSISFYIASPTKHETESWDLGPDTHAEQILERYTSEITDQAFAAMHEMEAEYRERERLIMEEIVRGQAK